jgi:hypothetical protein
MQLSGEQCRVFPLFFVSEEAFGNHVLNMRRRWTWATNLEITAAVHLLMRPVWLVTDAVDDGASIVKVEPPQCIAQEAWGETIYLAHFLRWHFEGTAHVAGAPAADSSGAP